MVEVSDHPSKRVKMDQEPASNSGSTRQNKSHHRPQNARNPGKSHGKNANRQAAVVSSSGIHNNDVGIFVTCDKGQEKKCLQEIVDLLSEEFDQSSQEPKETVESDHLSEDLDRDIEADIQAELDSLKPQSATASPLTQKLTCVMLDIPCVSFVRFPSGMVSSHDPVEIVRNLCTTAARKDFQGPRSRYIKRLTPISLVRKTMANGLEALCDELLPAHFMVDEDPSAGPAVEDADKPHPQGFKFAIRPTVRNNNKLDRDQVIRTVATKVEALGKGKHSVDLKSYDKLILVDVYRNIVGMSIVGSEFETLKRFNLSEIHSSHLGDEETSQKLRE